MRQRASKLQVRRLASRVSCSFPVLSPISFERRSCFSGFLALSLIAEGSGIMIRFIRLILIALMAMPQGWCCIAMDCGNCCDVSATVAPHQKTLSCACCTQLDLNTCHPDSSIDDRERIPKSCDCKCQFLIAATNPPPSVVATAIDSRFEEPFRMVLQSYSRQTVSAVSLFAFVRLQILQCSWQC